jgi:hypothetical protein
MTWRTLWICWPYIALVSLPALLSLSLWVDDLRKWLRERRLG